VSSGLQTVLRVLGIGALVAGGIVVALVALLVVLLIGPVIFWLAWNVLDFAAAVGLPELGFWGIVLATLFLVIGWFGKVVITAVVFLVEPSWFDGAARVHWPGADVPQLRRCRPTRPARVPTARSRARTHASPERLGVGQLLELWPIPTSSSTMSSSALLASSSWVHVARSSGSTDSRLERIRSSSPGPLP